MGSNGTPLFFDMKPKGGQMDIEELERSEDETTQQFVRDLKARDAAVRAKMSPPGALNLHPRLEAKRLEYGMIDSLFRQALFHRVFIWQIPSSETYGDSGLVVPDAYRKAHTQAEPSGIILSAGALAMDQLRTNGVEVGDTVKFVRLSPKRIEVDSVLGVKEHFLVCVASDIVSSDELDQAMHEGHARYVWDPETACHHFKMSGQQSAVPRHPMETSNAAE